MAKSKKWELSLKEARELRQRGAQVLYQRVSLLVACYEDEEFGAWCVENNHNDLEFLDSELEDTAAGFLTLKAVLDHYPEEDSWAKHNIRELIAEVLDAERQARKESGNERISWKERCLAAEKECERLRAERDILQKTLTDRMSCTAV